MRYPPYRRCARAVFRKVLPCRHDIYFVRCGSHLPVPLGLYLQAVAVVRIRGDAPLHRYPAGRLFLSLEERGARLEPPSRTPGPRFVTDTPDLEQGPTTARIRSWRPAAIEGVISFRGELTLLVPREHLRPLAEFLAGDADLAFTFLSDVTGMDRFPIEPRF